MLSTRSLFNEIYRNDQAYLYDRAFGWRRMVTLRMSERRNALGTPAPPHAEHEVP